MRRADVRRALREGFLHVVGVLGLERLFHRRDRAIREEEAHAEIVPPDLDPVAALRAVADHVMAMAEEEAEELRLVLPAAIRAGRRQMLLERQMHG